MRHVNTLKNKLVLGLAGLFMLGMVVAPAPASAQRNIDEGDVFGTREIEDPDTGLAVQGGSLQGTVVRLINVALSLLGIVAVVIVLIGGFKWMTAGGNEDKTVEARKLIFSGIIGMAIILSAWAIARFVLSNLASATNVRGADAILDEPEVQ